MTRSESDRKGRAAAPLPDIPDKLYFRIGEVARLLALPSYVLRFWETEFPHLKPGKGGTGQRLYRRREVDALIEIRRLLYDEGYTIPGARQFLKEKARAPEPPPLQEVLPDEDSDARISNAALQQLKTDLRSIADLLAEPVAGLQVTNLTHRGLHLPSRKRPARDLQPALFSTSMDTPAGEPDKE